MKQLSRSVVFNTNPTNERIEVLKDKNALDQLDDEEFFKSLIDRYQDRFSPCA